VRLDSRLSRTRLFPALTREPTHAILLQDFEGDFAVHPNDFQALTHSALRRHFSRIQPIALAALSVATLGLLASACGTGTEVVLGACDLTACDDKLECTVDGCASDGTCTHTPRTGACDDGNACTSGDNCQGATCAGSPSDCDDKLGCTIDSCDKTKGCVHLPGDPTICDDKNLCTDDSCDLTKGCKNAPNNKSCDDGNACTQDDTCGGGACLPGGLTVACDDKNACTDDSCDSKTGACAHLPNAATCDDGNTCTEGDKCSANSCTGVLNCVCAKAAGQPVPAENCDTPIDDNCNGFVNDADVCGPTLYKYGSPPECGATCYYDEGHNVAVSGAAADNSGYGTYGIGQLTDGVKGADDWLSNLGAGTAFEWVAWTVTNQAIVAQFPKPRNLALVRIGLNNKKDGSVSQPPEIQLRLSMDGVKWSNVIGYTTAAGTEPLVSDGHRGDIELPLPTQVVRYVEIRFVTSGSWTFIDELEFD
jgi:hypothetical protein